MKLFELQKQIEQLIAKNPEAANMEVMQTSCFDDPYRFAVSGVFVGEAFKAVDESWFSNVESAEERNEQEGEDASSYDEVEVVVIEAY